MSGRTPREVVHASVDRLQLALSCVTKAKLCVSRDGLHDRSKLHALLLNDGRPTPLGGKPKMSLGVKMQYRIVEDPGPTGPWKVRTAAYKYAIETNDGQELIVYHWHPDAHSPMTKPHMHVGAAILQPDGVLGHKDHVPTGRVALQQVVRLAIELGAKPLRDDWRDVLDQTEREFLLTRTW